MNIKCTTPIVCVLTLVASPIAFAQTTAEKVVEKTTTTVEKTTKAIEPGSLTTSIRDSTSLSIFYKALVATGLDVTLGAKGGHTVFAPTDEAFSKLPKGALDKLMLPENKEKLRMLVLHHVVEGTNNGVIFKDDTKIKCQMGELLEIDVDGATIKVDKAKVSGTATITNNGLLYAIDQVMIPKGLDGFANLDV